MKPLVPIAIALAVFTACGTDEDDAPSTVGVGASCGDDRACASDYCQANQCREPTDAAHGDGRRNAGETGVDCGGRAGPQRPCPGGQPCKGDGDCMAACIDGICSTPSATDRKKNNGETDIDCGGPNAPACAVGKTCERNGDCELLACSNLSCVVPTATDGAENGGETDIDCGGPGVAAGGISYQAPRCTTGKKCAAAEDCRGGGCSGAKLCTVPSCGTGESAGIVTCGAGETGAGDAAHESCCKSLVMPTRPTMRLDKYEITAGRFRTFLTKAGPNLRAWVKSYSAANPTSQLARMVATYPVLAELYPERDRGGPVSLTAHMSLDLDSYGGNRGCYNGTGNYSANTYWQDDEHLADFGLPSRSLARSVSDEKPLNCAMPLMFIAFCAWDGGEVPRYSDYLDVWPASQVFPWGAANLCTEPGGEGTPGNYKPCNAFNWCNGPFENGGFKCQNLSLSVTGEPGVFYEFPRGTDRSKDNSPLIAAPGRFPRDATLAKADGESWLDLMGNLAEYTGDLAQNPSPPPTLPFLNTFCDLSSAPVPGATTCTRAGNPNPGTLYTGIPQVGVLGSAFEGHQYVTATVHGAVESMIPATFQYGKFGARCMRPASAY